jgi:hypothetical protein
MDNQYFKLLQETFSDVQSMTPDKLRKVIDESMQYFQTLQGRFASENPKDREEALAESMELRGLLEKQMAALCEATGFDPAQLTAFVEDASNFSPQDQEILNEVKAKLKTFAPAAPKKKKNTVKIAG